MSFIFCWYWLCGHSCICVLCSKHWPAPSWRLCSVSSPAPVRPAASASVWSFMVTASVCFRLDFFFIYSPTSLSPTLTAVVNLSLHLFSPLQEDGLRQIFMMTMEVLQEFSRRENLNAQMSCVFQRYLALANQLLSWNFLPPNHILSFVFLFLFFK